MTNEVDDFLKGLNNEPTEDPFKPIEENPFNDKVEVKDETIEETKEKEEKVPFHKDPKLQKFIDKEISKRLSEIKPTEVIREVEKERNEDPMTDVLTRIIGNDNPEKLSAIKDFKNALGNMKNEAKQEALQEIQAKENEERQAEVEAQNELSVAFENIEEQFDVDLTSNNPTARKTRGEFVDFIKRIAPKDRDGEVTEFPDFKEAFTLFTEMKKPESNNRAKELSSRSMARSNEASSVSQNTGKSWKDVEKLFSKLQN